MAAAPPLAETAWPAPKPPRRWAGLLLHGAVLGLVLGLAVEVGYAIAGGHRHTVVPGRVYRCAQPSPGRLDAFIRRHGIRTVVNLRGCCDTFPWYWAEARTLAARDVAQEDVCLSARRLPPVAEARRLVEILDRVEYPILVHCHQGIDRTGLTCAMALMLHTDAPYSEARRQLGPRYGHFRVGQPARLDEFFDQYEAWLRDEGRPHSPAGFREWVQTIYDGGLFAGRIEAVDLPAAAAAGRPVAGRVRCRNDSRHAWPFRAGQTAGMHVIWKLVPPRPAAAAEYDEPSGRAGLFNAVVGPGESIDVDVVLPAPTRLGHYAAVLDLIDEQHCCFFQVGTEPLLWEFDVREQQAAVGGEHRPAGLAGLADQLAPGR